MWASYDLDAWTTTPLPSADVPGHIVQAATHVPGRDVAIIRVDQTSMTSISDDGIHWQAADRTSPAVETIATGPAGHLGLVGVWDDAGENVTGFEVWKLLEGR